MTTHPKPPAHKPPADPNGTPVPVNESLARGLRQRLSAHIREAMTASANARLKLRARSAPATRKGTRRIFQDLSKGYAKLLITPATQQLDDRYGVWLCWHLIEPAPGCQASELGAAIHLIDLFTGDLREIEMPVRLNSHLIERLFQRLGTVDIAQGVAEIRSAMLWSVVLGIVVRHCQNLPDHLRLNTAMPFLLPTPHGAVLGDLLPEWPNLSINTFIGGRREVTAAKASLRGAMQTLLESESEAEIVRWILIYFAGLYTIKNDDSRMGKEHREVVERVYEFMDRFVGVMKRHRQVLQPKAARERDLGREELVWKWAQLQHRTQTNGEDS